MYQNYYLYYLVIELSYSEALEFLVELPVDDDFWVSLVILEMFDLDGLSDIDSLEFLELIPNVDQEDLFVPLEANSD